MVQKWNQTLSQIPVWAYLKNGIGLGLGTQYAPQRRIMIHCATIYWYSALERVTQVFPCETHIILMVASQQLAAANTMHSLPTTNAITPAHGKIQDKDTNFYEHFNVVIGGLDNVEAWRWVSEGVAYATSWLIFPYVNLLDRLYEYCIIHINKFSICTFLFPKYCSTEWLKVSLNLIPTVGLHPISPHIASCPALNFPWHLCSTGRCYTLLHCQNAPRSPKEHCLCR